MRIQQLLIAIVLVIASVQAFAQQAPPQAQQQPPSPEQMKQMMQATMEATMGAMTAAMGPMTEAVIEAQLKSAAKPETAERIATFKKNLYDALIKKGFKAQEALQIVLSSSPPSASPSAK